MRRSLTKFCWDFQFRVVQRCDNLVDLDECCKQNESSIYLQRLVPIQPRTSLLKFDHLVEKFGVKYSIVSFNLWMHSAASPWPLARAAWSGVRRSSSRASTSVPLRAKADGCSRYLSWKIRSAMDRTIRTFQIRVRSEFGQNSETSATSFKMSGMIFNIF